MLMSIAAPAGWSVLELDQGTTIRLAGEDLDASITLLPSRLLGNLMIDLPHPLALDDLVEHLAPLLSPLDDVVAQPPRTGEVGPWQALVVFVERRGRSGEVLVFEPEPDLLAIASWSTTLDRESAVDAARSIIGSLEVGASVDRLLSVIDAPPPPDFPTV